jgi:hypothetical protein
MRPMKWVKYTKTKLFCFLCVSQATSIMCWTSNIIHFSLNTFNVKETYFHSRCSLQCSGIWFCYDTLQISSSQKMFKSLQNMSCSKWYVLFSSKFKHVNSYAILFLNWHFFFLCFKNVISLVWKITADTDSRIM